MFEYLLARKTEKDAQKMIKPMSLPKTPNELYRVGVTSDGMTTLTIMSTDGFSVTLSMSQAACKKMIRMLQSTFPEEDSDDSDTV